VKVLARLARRGVEVRILHSGVPSGPFREDLKTLKPNLFEMGLISNDPALVDTVADLFEAVWSGAMCKKCDRRAFCPVPLESPWNTK
jgi:hypothetical protein